MRTKQISRSKNLMTTNKRKRSKSSSKDSKLKTKRNLRKSLKSSGPKTSARTMTTVRRSARKASAELEFSHSGVKDKKQSEHIKNGGLSVNRKDKRKKLVSSPKMNQKRKGGVK